MNRIIVMGILSALLVCGAAGCSKDDPEIAREFTIESDDAYYDSETNTINFKGARSTVRIRVVTEDATGKWDARCPTDDLWCSFSKSEDCLIVTVDVNETDNMRYSYITILLDGEERTVNVAQDYLRRLAFVSGQMIIGAASGDYQIGLTTNILAERLHFTVQDENGALPGSDFWLEAGEYLDGTVSFRVEKNYSESDDRKALLVVSGDDTEASLLVVQNHASGSPYIVPLDDLNYDFDTCLSYEIWDSDEKIGNICREYLLKGSAANTEISTVAVVVYPVNDGIPDHTNGFVLATIDPSTGAVTPDGGKLMWNSSIDSSTSGYDMLASYLPGDLAALPKNLYRPLGGSRFSTDPLDDEDTENAVEARIAPWVVTDRREGEEISGRGTYDEFDYRVVKVGDQYWFADNLKTTRFKDGTPIPTNDWDSETTLAEPRCASAGYTSTGTSFSSANANSVSSSAVEVRNETGPVYNYWCLFNAKLTDATNAYDGSFEEQLAPDGWGVPTRSEFTILNNYITQCSSNSDTDTKLSLVLPSVHETAATNETGFGATCYRYRSATGTNSSNGIHYAVVDGYSFTGTAGAGTATDHKTVAFCCGMDTNTTFRTAEVRWGIYVRCIQRPVQQ